MKLAPRQWIADHPQYGTYFVTRAGGALDVTRVWVMSGEHMVERIASGIDSIYAAAEVISDHVAKLDRAQLVIDPGVIVHAA